MPTDAYRSWLAAHPDLDALDDSQKDHEAALAMGWEMDASSPTWVRGRASWIGVSRWHPTTDASQALECAQATAAATGWLVRVAIDSIGASAHAPVGNMPAILDVPDYPHSAESFPAALTTACLAAWRAMMERDDAR